MPGTVGIVWTVVILGLLFLCALVRMAERRTTRRVLSGFRPWCQTEYAVTASSDHPAVTNSVSTYDLLGRLVSTAVPGANGGALVTSNLYDGATSRIVTATKTGSLPVNYAYDEFGERIGMIKGNRSVWNRTTYETVSQEVYRVVTTVRMTGSTTNSVQIQKTQLTGLSDACRRHTVTLTGNAAILAAAGTTGVPPVGGSVTDTLTTYDPNTGIEASVSRTDGQTPVVTRSLYGIPIEQTTLDNRCTMSYDAFARNVVNIYENVATGATNRTEAIVYDLSGNAVCRAVDYGADGVAVATAEFDVLNRMVRRTDALGHETVMEYDVFDRPVFTGGDAYPVRTSYDTQGRKTGSSTTRDGGATWDETQWEFDPVSGVNTAKQYADGSRISYDYTDNGQKTRTTWARGAWKEHAYNVRNLVSGTTYSGTVTPLVVYTYADSDKLISATLSDGTSYAYAYDDALLCTNETATIAGDNFTVMRTYDAFQRNEETSVMVTNIRHVAKARLYDAENRVCGYALTNSFGRGLNVSLRYDGSHLTNMVYTLPNGNHFAVTLTRNASRKELVTLRDYSFGAQSVYWYSTDYDLIGRPTNATDSVSLMREWLYNNRSELAVATVGANNYGYAYDSIGNRLWSAANLATNTYAVNSLNQYATAAAPGTPQTTFIYDADGNMTRDGTYIYSYDAENRLRSVTARVMTNGALRVLNAYDHRNRRIRKTVQQLHISVAQPPALPFEIREWQTLETHTFVRDGNNIVLEKVEFADGTVRTFEYYWGPDKSGTELGAGGVGGLLAVSVDGVFYIPCYDHNGNIILYVSETGSIAAQYAYDPYGNIVDSNGNLADVFNFGFSTQYHDRETGMVGYKRRFYRPDLGRWLNRDPIEEDGGPNLYVFCGNEGMRHIDSLGEARMLTGALFALKGSNRLPYPGYAIARSIIRLIDNLNSIRKNGKKIFDAKICDFATASLSSIQKEVSENPDHTYFIAHGGISDNGRTFGGSTYIWNRGNGVIELIFPKGNRTAGIPVSSLGPKLNYGNVFGCFLSPRVRKIVVGPWYNKRTESSWDTYDEMYKALYNRLLRYKAGEFTGCIKIRVYEGENNNEYGKPYAETNNAMTKYPIRTEEEYQ